MFYNLMDPTYWMLIVPALLLAAWAQSQVKSSFNTYSRVYNRRGYTGAEVARMILDSNGLHHIRLERVSGSLTDHYDPKGQVIRLSDSVYGSTSVAALGVAAHEAGHAVQYAEGYGPIKLRTAIIPATQIGSQLAVPLVLLGFVFEMQPLVTAGILFYSLAAVFQLVTLPVEFNASSRAMAVLEQAAILEGEEVTGARKVLKAAALTYVAALITALAQLLRLIMVANRRRDD